MSYEDMPPIKKTNWKLIIGIIVAALIVGIMCIVGVGLVSNAAPLPKDPVIPAFDTSPSRTGSATQPTVVLPKPVVLKGKNNAVAQVGSTLNGAFKVEYTFGSWCGIVKFLNAKGTDGAEFFEMINECAGDTNAKAAGSTIVHLTNVTMVKVENTSGNWQLTFTPVGD